MVWLVEVDLIAYYSFQYQYVYLVRGYSQRLQLRMGYHPVYNKEPVLDFRPKALMHQNVTLYCALQTFKVSLPSGC